LFFILKKVYTSVCWEVTFLKENKVSNFDKLEFNSGDAVPELSDQEKEEQESRRMMRQKASFAADTAARSRRNIKAMSEENTPQDVSHSEDKLNGRPRTPAELSGKMTAVEKMHAPLDNEELCTDCSHTRYVHLFNDTVCSHSVGKQCQCRKFVASGIFHDRKAEAAKANPTQPRFMYDENAV
jgi:hypothetical protein